MGGNRARKGLTAKQERFCKEYLIDLNSTQAAIRAGYSEKTADKTGWENQRKPEIAQRIQALMKIGSEKLEIKKEDNLRVLKSIRDICVSDILSFDGKKITYKDLADIPKELMPAIKAIKQRETKAGDMTIEVVLYDKHAAVDTLNKMLGFYEPEKVELSGEVAQVVTYQLPDNGR